MQCGPCARAKGYAAGIENVKRMLRKIIAGDKLQLAGDILSAIERGEHEETAIE